MIHALHQYYELRLYKMLPGKLGTMHHWMGADFPAVFARNGLRHPLGCWEGLAGPIIPLYAYLLGWENVDYRMRAWDAFYKDPDWVRHRDSERPVERSHIFLLRPSHVWKTLLDPARRGPVGGVHELLMQQILNRAWQKGHDALAEIDLPFFQKRGALVLGIFETWIGSQMPQVVTLLAWPDMETRRRALADHVDSVEIREARRKERQRYGRPLFGRNDSYLMHPAPYAMPCANLSVSDK